MRKKLANITLTASALVWGTWFGGQFFNWAMVIPKRLSNPPESIKAYAVIPQDGGFPFFLLNPFFFLLSLLSMFLAWKWAQRSRKWLLITTLIAFSVSLVLIFYLAPLIHSTDYIAGSVSLPAQQLIGRVNEWKTGNIIRLIFDFLGFLFSLIALKTWSEEASAAISTDNPEGA
jgi:hypothetical protein